MLIDASADAQYANPHVMPNWKLLSMLQIAPLTKDMTRCSHFVFGSMDVSKCFGGSKAKIFLKIKYILSFQIYNIVMAEF